MSNSKGNKQEAGNWTCLKSLQVATSMLNHIDAIICLQKQVSQDLYCSKKLYDRFRNSWRAMSFTQGSWWSACYWHNNIDIISVLFDCLINKADSLWPSSCFVFITDHVFFLLYICLHFHCTFLLWTALTHLFALIGYQRNM